MRWRHAIFPGQAGGQVKNIQPQAVREQFPGNPAAMAAGRATKMWFRHWLRHRSHGFDTHNYGFATAGRSRTACRRQYDTCLRGWRPDGDHRGHDWSSAAGTAASGRRALSCQYSAIWHGAYRGATDGGHGKLHRGGGNILPVELAAYDMDGQAGLFVPNTAERTAMKSRRQYRGQFRDKHLVRTQCLATTRHGRDKGRVLGGDSQYLATKMREVKVAVKANYQLY